MTSAWSMVNANATEAGICRLSVALISKCETPDAVGVPLITPVDVFNVRPAGKVPEVIAPVSYTHLDVYKRQGR